MIDLTKLTQDLVRQHNLATEKLTEKALEKEYDKAKKELVKYENEVLKLTTLC